MVDPLARLSATFARLTALLLLATIATLTHGCASQCNVEDRDLFVLCDDLSPLRSAFDRWSDRWRVVSLVSPTCSECVLGAEAVEKEITARYPASEVAAIVVWIPMLESDSEEGARASASIFPPHRAAQYYDAHQAVGWAYARHTFAGFMDRARTSLPEDHWLAPEFENRRDGERPQWDLYMLYRPGVRWSDEAPPMPTHWIRHVGRGVDGTTSTYWRDTPESGPREGDLFEAMRQMADEAMTSAQRRQ